MKMALDGATGVNSIRSYEPGVVRIRDRTYQRSLIVLPDRLIEDWGPTHVTELRNSHLAPIIEATPEVLILGTGELQSFPDPASLSLLVDMNIGFEVMDNAAACRTFNILLAEQRRTALALVFSAST